MGALLGSTQDTWVYDPGQVPSPSRFASLEHEAAGQDLRGFWVSGVSSMMPILSSLEYELHEGRILLPAVCAAHKV